MIRRKLPTKVEWTFIADDLGDGELAVGVFAHHVFEDLVDGICSLNLVEWIAEPGVVRIELH